MKRILIPVILILGLLLMCSPVSATFGVEVTSKTGDGKWVGDAWEVSLFPGETANTTLTLHNSSSDSLDVEVSTTPDSSASDNITFTLSSENFTMSGGSYTSVILTASASGSAVPGTYTAQLEIKSEVTPVAPATPVTPSGGDGGGGGGAPSDSTPPVISEVRLCPEGVTETTANICWTTSEPGTSQVEYWTSPGRFSPFSHAYVTEHHIELTGLIPDTTYYYKTMSRDAAGKLAVSDEYDFTTLKEEEELVEPVEPIEPIEPVEPEIDEPEIVEPELEEPEPDEPEPEQEISWSLIVGIVAGLAAAGGIIYWRKRKA